MPKCYLTVSILFGISSLSLAFADESGVDNFQEPESSIQATEITAPTSMTHEPFFAQPEPSTLIVPPVEKTFSPFTGKIKGRKVRLRASADLDGRVVKELNRQDLLVVVGEKGDFYAVEPPSGTKAYVFRSFILDGVVEGNRVNVRLEPSLDAPVIGHLNSGDHIKGALSSQNNKWYEIAPPAGTRFYVAKEFIESIGGPEIKTQFDKRRATAEQLLDAAVLLTQVELKKSFRDINIEKIKENYQRVMNEFSEFSDLCDKAKEGFTAIVEEYTQRKIAYLEEKAEGKEGSDTNDSTSFALQMITNPTDRMKMWEPIEESLYLTWSARNDDRSIDEFYEEEKQKAVVMTGFIEPYTDPVQRKPGDYFLKDGNVKKAYLYSTHVNLQNYVGKKVSIIAAPRPNNNFAYQAFFVLSVE
jgi:hypothetical protein